MQKVTCKGCMDEVTYTEPRRSLIIQNFVTPWERSFSIILTKNFRRKTSGEMFCTFAGMISATPDSKLCNLMTSWKLIKTPQNFSQGFSPQNRKKYTIKTEAKLWHHVPFKIQKYPESYQRRLIGLWQTYKIILIIIEVELVV